jgi:hypothetical protein
MQNRLSNVVSGKKKGKQSRGYVPGDARGNFMRAWCGKPFPSPPYKVNPDLLRQFVIVECFELKPDSRQVRFFTCDELMDMAWRALKWPAISKDKDRDETLLSAKRQLRNICRELGVELKKGRVGRPPGKAKTGKF